MAARSERAAIYSTVPMTSSAGKARRRG